MRAVEPTLAGRISARGFSISYEVFGERSAPAVLLLPTWQIAPSLHWKLQVAELSRAFRVVTYDPPGIGGGERTSDAAAFELDRVVDYATDLLDHLEIGRAHVVGLSMGGAYGLWLTARHPDRVDRLVLMSTVSPEWAFAEDPAFFERRDRYEGWEKRNAHYWREHYEDWLAFFMEEVFSEPHSTKAIEDAIAWARQTTPEILIASVANPRLQPQLTLDEVVRRIERPVLLMHARDDHVADVAMSRALAAARPDWEYVEFEAGGHAIHVSQPVRVNLELARFLGTPVPRSRTLRRAMTPRPPRALVLSSPIGLGHVHRDLAIMRELRRLVDGIEIEWLAQHPVSRVLEQAGERLHPLSAQLAGESAHCEAMAGEHELHAFRAFRELDEIFLANFMVFLDAVRDARYELWIGDEAWEVDHHLHENPDLKTAPYVFLTDFIGFQPIDDRPGSPEARLTADYNAEMVEHVARHPRVRDRAIYLGELDDLLPDRLGPGLPTIREWTNAHFTATGYVAPYDDAASRDVTATRPRLGYAPDQPLIIYAVGGTAIGEALLRKAIDAWPVIQAQRPDARCVAVAGPRIDPAGLPQHRGLEVRGYVSDLYKHLAVCDLAVVQGGLSTTMELTVARRPFLYFPLANHFEQLYAVAHRLDVHHAGRRLSYEHTSSSALAEAALHTLGADTSGYRLPEPGAARRAAALIAELL